MAPERRYWLDEPRNVTKIFRGLCIVCGLLAVPDALHLYDKHAHLRVEDLWDFHGLYGFVSCVALVLAAKVLRRIVMRGEDYYD